MRLLREARQHPRQPSASPGRPTTWSMWARSSPSSRRSCPYSRSWARWRLPRPRPTPPRAPQTAPSPPASRCVQCSASGLMAAKQCPAGTVQVADTRHLPWSPQVGHPLQPLPPMKGARASFQLHPQTALGLGIFSTHARSSILPVIGGIDLAVSGRSSCEPRCWHVHAWRL